MEHATLEGPDGPFRILQLTDFHSDVSEADNERTRADIRVLTARHRPHFLAVTGDIWCGDARPNTAIMWMDRDIDFLASLGVPWAFVRGNHDYAWNWREVYAQIAASPNAMQPRGDGDGRFRVTITRDGAPQWDLLFLNSGEGWRLPGDLEWFQSECMRLRKERGEVTPAVVFFHIPLGAYRRAMEEGRARGLAKEDVLCWGDEADRAAGILAGAGNVRACFCGHSHRNDFWFEEGGVIFAHGRATGYGGYGGEDVPKGATLIELGPGSALGFQTVFAELF